MNNNSSLEKFFYKSDRPGIFGLECNETKRSLLLSSSNILRRILKLSDQLSDNTIKHKQLKKDLEKYGPDSFQFFLIDSGPIYYDIRFRKKKLREIKRSWSGLLY